MAGLPIDVRSTSGHREALDAPCADAVAVTAHLTVRHRLPCESNQRRWTVAHDHSPGRVGPPGALRERMRAWTPTPWSCSRPSRTSPPTRPSSSPRTTATAAGPCSTTCSGRATRSPRRRTRAASLETVFAHPADLVILDFDLGGGTSDVLTKIRRRSSVPVIVCSGRSSERERVGLLNLGADDFLAEAVLLRRARGPDAGGPAARQRHPDDDPRPRRARHRPGHPQVTVGESEVAMTRKEFDLLAFLASAPGGCSRARTCSSGSGAPTDAGRAGRR